MKIKEEIIKLDDISLWMATQGEGLPVILSHGGPGIYDYLKPVADMIDDLSFVIRYDQRGCGRSEKKRPYDLDIYLKDMENIRKYFGIDKWIVGGHSWGANLSLVYALKYPERIKGIIYLSGTGITEDWRSEFNINMRNKLTGEEYERFSHLKYTLDFSSSYKGNKLEKEYFHLFLKTCLYDPSEEVPMEQDFPLNNEVALKLWKDWEDFISNHNMEEELRKLDIPAVLIYGKGDPRPFKILDPLVENLSNNKYLLLEKGGHFPWWEEPEKVKKALREFLGNY